MMLVAIIAYLFAAIMTHSCLIDFIHVLRIRTGLEGVIGFYRELQIWNGDMNYNFFYFILPSALFFAERTIALLTYGVIRLSDNIPWIIYPTLVLADLVAIVFAMILIPYAAKVHDNSKEHLAHLRKKIRSKHARRLVKSL